MPVHNRCFNIGGVLVNYVTHEVFVKLKTERLLTSSHFKAIKP